MFPRVDNLRGIEFGTPGTSREALVNLVLHGNKRATAGLLSEYETEGDLDASDFRASHLAFWTRVGETVTSNAQLSAVTKRGHTISVFGNPVEVTFQRLRSQ